MKSAGKTIFRVGVFGALVATVLLCLNSFFQPVWFKWNNYNTTKGFYEEPKNTIETLFLGASIVLSSVSPMEMYDEYGINVYNLGTEQQPVLGTYYWLEEAYELHSETLKTVVFDVSALRSASRESFYHKALDNMRFSDIKLRAVYDYMDGNIQRTVSFLVPLISYHNRWDSLDNTDIEKYSYDADIGTRGYYFIKSIYANKDSYKNAKIKSPVLDKNAEPAELLEDSLEYFDRVVKFCEEKGLNLLLIKTAAKNWSSSLHNAVQEVADSYGLEFLDFNFDPLYGHNGYVPAFDTTDGIHMNHFGAVKFSKWLGKYLVDNYGATDVRNNPEYDFMKTQFEEYTARVTQAIDLDSAETLKEYLEIAAKEENTVFISVKDEASTGLTEDDRKFLKEIGLEELSDIEYREPYIGIIKGGKVTESDGFYKDGKPIADKGFLSDGETYYEIKSGGKDNGDIAEIIIGSESQIKAGRGINIVVYSDELGEVIGSATFDTYISSERDCYGTKSAGLLLDEEALMKEYSPSSVRGRIISYQAKIDELRAAASE